jgi:putative transposase
MQYPSDSFATRRHLPHIENVGKTYDLTFCTAQRVALPPQARDLALRTIVREHRESVWLETAIVMPDHVHAVFTPFPQWRLPTIMQRIKGVSSHRINDFLQRRGMLWQDESFDRIVRREENLREKCDYIAMNPVRKGLVSIPDEYPWLWRRWIDDPAP